MPEESHSNDLRVLTDVIAALKTLDSEGQKRTFQSVAMFLGLELREAPSIISASTKPANGSTHNVADSFSEERSISPKDFLIEKQPRTEVERIACLAYYLRNYRDMPYFKTLDISTLNTEAAQPKFSNPARSVDHATQSGYLAAATQGNKQLSAAGELFVQALPDREAAKNTMAHARPRRKTRKPISKKVQPDPAKVEESP